MILQRQFRQSGADDHVQPGVGATATAADGSICEGERMKKNRKQENHDTRPYPANQCVACGAEMPEGDQVCTRCRERAAFNRNASQTIDDRIRELEAEIRMLRGVKKAMGGRDDYII